MLALLPFLLAPTADAGGAYPWFRELTGVGLFPSGALSDTRVQVRTPGHRSDSIVFRDTYYGAGARLQVSPAFVDVGPRVSIAPIDVFDLDLQASWTGYAGPYAPQPFDELVGKLESMRSEHRDERFPMSKIELSASPTLKLQVGPIIAFDSALFSWVRAHRPEDQTSRFWYEPYRDLVLAWEDVTLENQGAVVWAFLPGGDRPQLWVGATARHRRAFSSRDVQTNAGLLVVARPGVKPAVPSFTIQALPFLADEERVGTAPALNLAASWVLEGD